MKTSFLLLLILIFTGPGSIFAQPFTITAYISGEIITGNDASLTTAVTYGGQSLRWVYDRRIPGWINIETYIYDVAYADGLSMEIAVNPEFSVEQAAIEAEKYSFIMGQLPACLREGVHSLWIHMGDSSFGGGFNAVIVHTGLSTLYESQQILEEVLVHEAVHASDPVHSGSPGWTAAQDLDDAFISTYGAASPEVEDLAESFVAWLAINQCDLRISETDSATIAQTIPNRISYFDGQFFDLHPVCAEFAGIGETSIMKPVVSPNPFSSDAVISNLSEDASVVVFTAAGVFVKKQAKPGNGTFRLERKNLEAGTYLLHITSGSNSFIQKCVIID